VNKSGAWNSGILASLLVAACNGSGAGPDSGPSIDANLDAEGGNVDTTETPAVPVVSITPLRPGGGGRLDWCANDRIVYDTVAVGGVWSVHTMDPDGSNDTCLTCGSVPGLPANTIVGQPAWHPSCEWIVLQVKSTTLSDGAILPRYFGPGWGVHSDLYLLKADASIAYPLVTLATARTASLHPQFSADGNYLYWAVRDPLAVASDLTELTSAWRGWYISIAQIDVDATTPALGARVDFYRTSPASARGFYETHALRGPTMWMSRTLDGARVVDEGFSADVSTPSVMTNWTQSPGTWEEHTMPSPTGALVTYNSSQPSSWHNPPDADFDELPLELWAMVVATGERVQLTHFNDELTPTEVAGGVRATTADYAWAPDGRQIGLYSVKHTPAGQIVHQRIDLITLGAAY